jgi:hypothetical protein
MEAGSGKGRRQMQWRPERDKGEKRHHRRIEEKLRKYEARGEGYEFVPALMHVLGRYVHGVPAEQQSDLDRRMAAALDEVPRARELLSQAVKVHEGIPPELKRRVFSPRYLNLDPQRAIDVEEAAGIVTRANLFKDRLVRDLPELVAQFPPEKDPKRGCCCPDGGGGGGEHPPPPPPHQYELTFTKLYCVDESDPEWFGSDEPYAVFGVITEEMAESGTPANAVHTPVYEDVDDGDTRPSSGDENLRLFGFTGPRAIDSSVLVTATCFEHDLGDVSDTTDKVRSALTAVATKAASAGGVAGWVIAGVAVVGIGVSYLVDLIGADDQINGTRAFSMREVDADAATAAVNPAILPVLHFDGGDDDGIYDLYLKLRRV